MATNDVHVFADSSAISCAQNCVTCRPHTYEIQPGVREQRITAGVEFFARMIRKEVKAMFIRTVRAARVPVRKPSIIVCIPAAAYKLMFVTENLIIDDATHLENALGEKWGHHEVLCEDEFDGTLQVVYEVKCFDSDAMWPTPVKVTYCKTSSEMKMTLTIARYNRTDRLQWTT